MSRPIYLVLVVAILALGAQDLSATVVTTDLSVRQGSGGGASFSWLHTANGTGSGAAMSGTKVQLGSLRNMIRAEYDTSSNVLSVIGSYNSDTQLPLPPPALPLEHAGLVKDGYTYAVQDSLKFTGGKFYVHESGDGGLNLGVGGGYLDYEVTYNGGQTDIGKFYFANEQVLNSAPQGTFANSSLAFQNNSGNWEFLLSGWGNNWMYGNAGHSRWRDVRTLLGDANYHDQTSASGIGPRLGLDLRLNGTGTPTPPGGGGNVPEPGSIAIWSALSLVGLAVSRRRLRKRG